MVPGTGLDIICPDANRIFKSQKSLVEIPAKYPYNGGLKKDTFYE